MNLIWQRLQSKTYIAALILSVLTILEANFQVLALLVPPKYQPYTPLIFPLAMMVCREFTKEALGEK